MVESSPFAVGKIALQIVPDRMIPHTARERRITGEKSVFEWNGMAATCSSSGSWEWELGKAYT